MGAKRFLQRVLDFVGLRVMRASRYQLEQADRARERAEAVALGDRLVTVERRLDAAEHGLSGAHARASVTELRVGGAEASVRDAERRLDASEHGVAGLHTRMSAAELRAGDSEEALRSAERRLGVSEHRADGILAGLAEARRLMRTLPAWYENMASEPGVQLALADLVRVGDTCFDVGGFQGDLTLLLARLVGPRGIVCTFEANPAMLGTLTHNCVANGLGNVHLTHAAVWHRSGEWLNLVDPGEAAAVAVTDAVASPSSIRVESLALDDFVSRYGLIPQVVKLDVEGAEKHALRGFAHTLAEHRPHLVMEHYVGYDDALAIVRGLGYRAFCTNQYTEVRSSADLMTGATLRNLACVHADRLADTPFAGVGGLETVRTLRPGELTPRLGGWTVTLELPAGRYVATADVVADPHSVLCYQSITSHGVQGQYYERAERFASSCRDLPFDLPAAGAVTLTLFDVSNNQGLRVDTIRIDRVSGYGFGRGLE